MAGADIFNRFGKTLRVVRFNKTDPRDGIPASAQARARNGQVPPGTVERYRVFFGFNLAAQGLDSRAAVLYFQ
jgi:hypothetical protein